MWNICSVSWNNSACTKFWLVWPMDETSDWDVVFEKECEKYGQARNMSLPMLYSMNVFMPIQTYTLYVIVEYV